MMIRETIRSLTHFYSMICMSKGIVADKQLENMAVGAHALSHATSVLAGQQGEPLTSNDKNYLKEMEMIDQQIEEMFCYLQTLEII